MKSAGCGWSRVQAGSIVTYAADAINAVPGVVQGFTTRHGGSGCAPYDTLNLSLSCGDDPAIVKANRARLAQVLKVNPSRQVFAEQVHGAEVAVIRGPHVGSAPLSRADALLTNIPGLLLTLQFADCFPVFIADPVNRAVAVAHSGWRGTAANIAANVLAELQAQFGTNPADCLAAVGPGIAGESYEVGEDVARSFFGVLDTSGNSVAVGRPGREGRWSLHLRRAIQAQLLACGCRHEAVAISSEDTYTNEIDFFSHRREAQRDRGTGRMAGCIGILPA